MAKLDDLPLDNAPIADRWTLTKLFRGGWQEAWSRDCRVCGDEIVCFSRQPGSGGKLLLILNAGVLTPHRCDGT